ncbi:MAG: hypothetical protein ACQEST_12455, partial [Bacteroidota bacterium]
KKATLFFFFCFSLLFATQSIAQVSIAPTSLFFDEQDRYGSLTISNGGQQAQEISINLEFGYPTTQNGSLSVVKDSVMAEEKSIADWVKVFPKNFTIQPDERQTVRFVTRPGNDLEPGGYWSRVRIQSNPVSPPIESVEDGEVGAQINLVVNQVIAAHFHTQGAETGVEVEAVDFNREDDRGQIAVSMEQTGNAPFVGSISLELKNSDGETVWDTNTTNSVYTTITRSFNMDLSELDPGEYTISGEIASERRDISQDKLLQIQPVSFEKQITIE